MTTFRGILPPIITPFDEEERVLVKSLERLLERFYSVGLHGVYVCGNTGEGLLQSLAQRKQVAEVAVKSSPKGKLVIVHVGAYRTTDAVELAKHASRVGAHAVASLPPIGDYEFSEVQAHYRAIAAAADLPLFVYYIPSAFPTVQDVEQVLELLEIPNVIGVKFSDYNIPALKRVKTKRSVVFAGYEDVTVAALLAGADGAIGTPMNLFPELFLRIYELALAKQWQLAQSIQDTVNEFEHSVVAGLPYLPAMKLMLTWSGIEGGRCLAPRRPLTATEESELRRRLAQSKFAESSSAGYVVK